MKTEFDQAGHLAEMTRDYAYAILECGRESGDLDEETRLKLSAIVELADSLMLKIIKIRLTD